jgi:hypothetical protein
MITVKWPGQPPLPVTKIDYWSIAIVLHLADGGAIPIRLGEQEVRRIYDLAARGGTHEVELHEDPLRPRTVH